MFCRYTHTASKAPTNKVAGEAQEQQQQQAAPNQQQNPGAPPITGPNQRFQRPPYQMGGQPRPNMPAGFRPQHPTPGGTPPPGEPPQQVVGGVRGANPGGLQLPPRPQAPGSDPSGPGGVAGKAAGQDGAKEPYKVLFKYFSL